MYYYCKNRIKTSLWLLVVLLLIAAGEAMASQASLAGTQPTDKQHQKASAGRAFIIIHSFYSWMNADWTASDQEFAKIRKDIDNEIASGTPPGEVVRGTEAKFPQSDAPSSVFARGYASDVAACLLDSNTAAYNDALDQCRWAGKQIGYKPNLYPHTYNFVRLTFMLEGDVGDGVLKNVGVKLLKRDPSDQPIKDALITVLSDSGKKTDFDFANKLAEERLKIFPQDFGSYKRLAVVQFGEFKASHDIKFAHAAIASYQHAISLAKSFPGNQADYKDKIAEINELIAYWHAT